MDLNQIAKEERFIRRAQEYFIRRYSDFDQNLMSLYPKVSKEFAISTLSQSLRNKVSGFPLNIYNIKEKLEDLIGITLEDEILRPPFLDENDFYIRDDEQNHPFYVCNIDLRYLLYNPEDEIIENDFNDFGENENEDGDEEGDLLLSLSDIINTYENREYFYEFKPYGEEDTIPSDGKVGIDLNSDMNFNHRLNADFNLFLHYLAKNLPFHQGNKIRVCEKLNTRSAGVVRIETVDETGKKDSSYYLKIGDDENMARAEYLQSQHASGTRFLSKHSIFPESFNIYGFARVRDHYFYLSRDLNEMSYDSKWKNFFLTQMGEPLDDPDANRMLVLAMLHVENRNMYIPEDFEGYVRRERFKKIETLMEDLGEGDLEKTIMSFLRENERIYNELLVAHENEDLDRNTIVHGDSKEDNFLKHRSGNYVLLDYANMVRDHQFGSDIALATGEITSKRIWRNCDLYSRAYKLVNSACGYNESQYPLMSMNDMIMFSLGRAFFENTRIARRKAIEGNEEMFYTHLNRAISSLRLVKGDDVGRSRRNMPDYFP